MVIISGTVWITRLRSKLPDDNQQQMAIGPICKGVSSKARDMLRQID